MRHTINIVSNERSGPYVLTIRGGKVRRHRHVSAASLARVRGLVRAQAKGKS